MSWAQLEAPETPVAFHASATTTNKTNKQDKQDKQKNKNQTLNHGWTQSVSFAAPKSIFGLEAKWTHWFLHRSSNPKPDVLQRVMPTSTPLFFFFTWEKIGNFDFSVFILSFHLRKCQSWLQKRRKMTVIQYGNQPLSPYCYTLVITFLLVCIASEKKNTLALCCYGSLFFFFYSPG